MSYEAFGDGGDDNGSYDEDRVNDIFIAGLQAMREMLARFVENGGDTDCRAIANSMRANWLLSWGKDPGKPETIISDMSQA